MQSPGYDPFSTNAYREYPVPSSDYEDPYATVHHHFIRKFSIPRTGIIHVGGHHGEELETYSTMGIKKILMIEASPRIFEVLSRNAQKFNSANRNFSSLVGNSYSSSHAHAICVAISHYSGEIDFFQTGISSLSSTLMPNKSAFERYWRAFLEGEPWYVRKWAIHRFRIGLHHKKIIIQCKTLDEVMEELPKSWCSSEFSILRANIQGGELDALRGATRLFKHLRLISIETNLDSRYEHVPKKREIDSFLGKFGFDCAFAYRVSTNGNLIYRKATRIDDT